MEGEGAREGQPERALRTRQRSKASKSRVVGSRQRFGAVCWRRRNDREATAVVTRYGCGRVDFFEGCETRCGGSRGSASMDDVAFGRRGCLRVAGLPSGGNQASVDAANKRSEPCLASGCNTPERSSAEQAVEVVRNHEDGTRSCGWRRAAEGGGNVSGSGRTEPCRMRGTQRSKPMRGRSVETRRRRRVFDATSGASRRSDDETKAMRDGWDFSIESTHPRPIASGEFPEDPPVTEKVEGEGGEGQGATTARDGRYRLAQRLRFIADEATVRTDAP